LDLAAEELLERGVGSRVLSRVQSRQEPERVRGEDLRLDVRLRDLLAQRRQVPAPRAASAHPPVEVGEREGTVLEADLEVERPQRAALVGERAPDDRPAAIHWPDGVLDRHPDALEEHLVELPPAADLHERAPGDAGTLHVDDQAAETAM